MSKKSTTAMAIYTGYPFVQLPAPGSQTPVEKSFAVYSEHASIYDDLYSKYAHTYNDIVQAEEEVDTDQALEAIKAKGITDLSAVAKQVYESAVQAQVFDTDRKQVFEGTLENFDVVPEDGKLLAVFLVGPEDYVTVDAKDGCILGYCISMAEYVVQKYGKPNSQYQNYQDMPSEKSVVFDIIARGITSK